jgi:hypothetical protein
VLLGSPLSKKEGVEKVSEALQNFFDIHVPTLKPRTQYQIKRVLNRHFAKPFKHKRLAEIIHALLAMC